MPLDMTSVLAVYLSLLRNCGVPTGSMLVLMSELYPSGPVTTMLRALPPVEVHPTLNVNVPATTSIAAVTSVTGGEESYKNISHYIERWATHWGRGRTVLILG